MFFKKIDQSPSRFKATHNLKAKLAAPPSVMSQEELRRIVAEMVG